MGGLASSSCRIFSNRNSLSGRPAAFFLTETLFLGARPRTRYADSTASETAAWKGFAQLGNLALLELGDPVVHRDHGVGRYRGLHLVRTATSEGEFVLVEYAEQHRLYVPVYRLDSLQKYIGTSDAAPLDRLGTPLFEKERAKARDSTRKLAIDLIALQAERKSRHGVRIPSGDPEARAFDSRFPFEPTPDQERAFLEIEKDLASGSPMDRLICGDVGFGKTEVAMRAAFRVAAHGYQVAVLVPTTLLAFQHEQSFRKRFDGTPFRIESLSRFKSPAEQKRILEEVRTGRVDIVIGTHRLLSKDVAFRDLGLLVVDEEHRFGVEHKERIKQLRSDVHILTLTATPIPRTLHLALGGLRDISVMSTPPVDRQPIRTLLARRDLEIIRRAIDSEIARGGQLYFVHNRVSDILRVREELERLRPGLQIGVAHGQMSEPELEKVVTAFFERKTQLLLCTSIIESGLDVPSANTLIVDRADTFGLAQLYQIRGRVGRSDVRATAYFLVGEDTVLSSEAKQRLDVLQRFVELGSGFAVASHDLEIRGGGELIGREQSGHIAAIGFELYLEMLDEAVQALRASGGTLTSAPTSSVPEPELSVHFPAFLDSQYIYDPHQRLGLYRRLSGAAQPEDVHQIQAELSDRFGPLPESASNLLLLIRIKQLAKRCALSSLTVGADRIAIHPSSQSPIDPVHAIALAASDPSTFTLTPDSRIIVKVLTPPTGGSGASRALDELSRILPLFFPKAFS